MKQRKLNNYLKDLEELNIPELLSPQHSRASKDAYDKFLRNLEFQTLLEVGAGEGPVLREAATQGKIAKGLTLEKVVSEEYVIVQGDMHDMVFPDNSFDVVVARHVLEHSPMPIIALFEIRRVASKYVFVVIPAEEEHAFRYPPHLSVLSLPMWRKLFHVVELEIVGEELNYEWTKNKEFTGHEHRFLLKK